MIIKELSLKNFQAHEKLSVGLADFSAIIGPSSAGKSSILRALAWLFYGEWDNTYPNDPTKETAAAVKMDDGTIIGRFRKGKKNRAVIKRSNGVTDTFEDFGETIPGAMDIVNLNPIKIGPRKVNLNFSMQDDPIFLVTETGPAKAQWIGRLYGAHIVNQMLRLMSIDKRRIEADRYVAQEGVKSMKTRLTWYDGLEIKEQAASQAGSMLKELGSLSSIRDEMSDLMADAEAVKRDEWVLQIDTEWLKKSLNALESLKTLQDDFAMLGTERGVLEARKAILGLDTGVLRGDLERLQELRDIWAESLELSDQDIELDKEIPCVNGQLDDARKELSEGLFKGGRCPLCDHKPRKLDMEAVAGRLRSLIGE